MMLGRLPLVLGARSSSSALVAAPGGLRRLLHASRPSLQAGLSEETIATVKATVPVLAEHGYAITRSMYGRMLQDKEIAGLFNPAHQVETSETEKAQQPWTLACAVHAYAANIDNLGALTETVERIAQKHVSLAVLPHHYPVVGENLLWALKDVLGDAATPEVLKAWGEAYGFLADILVAREKQLREGKAAESGGWSEWRDFVVDRKVKESSEILSVYLRPKDGGPLMDYAAGSYTALRLELPDGSWTQRNYTLSKASAVKDGEWRITVKKQPPLHAGCPAGRVSSHLHDSVQVGDVLKLGVPCGDFVLKPPKDDKTPIVLLSGGVGLTPVIAMLEQLIRDKVKNNVYVLASARNPEVEAMHELLAEYRRSNVNIVIKVIYDQDTNGAYPQGPFSMDILDSMLVTRDCEYYFCGPEPFLRTVYKGLKQDWKIPDQDINFEFFGPADDLLAK